VGEIADRAARALQREGTARMGCLAGVAAGDPGILGMVGGADRLLVINGCPKKCAMQIVAGAGIDSAESLNLADLGLEKGQSEPTEANIELAAQRARELLGQRV
jgi:uncharacterized metal-binding protein